MKQIKWIDRWEADTETNTTAMYKVLINCISDKNYFRNQKKGENPLKNTFLSILLLFTFEHLADFIFWAGFILTPAFFLEKSNICCS